MTFPTYIQQAVDLGLLTAQDGKITACNEQAIDSVFSVARIVQKLQPAMTEQVESTTDQEAIVLCRVLSSPPGKARELWSELRVAFGVSHSQPIPTSLWSTPEFKAIGNEIDRTYMGERNVSLISREALVSEYAALNPASRSISTIDFTQTVDTLGSDETMASYGDAESEWQIALDLLRQSRVKAIYAETMATIQTVQKADNKMEKTIEFQQQHMMECLGMLRGSIGQQGNVKSMHDAFMGVQNKAGLIDRVLMAEKQEQPVSTTIPAMDIDMEGGVYPPGGDFTGGRLFTLAARTGVGKTILGANAMVGLARGGLKVGFISAELDEDEIWTRIGACATRQFNDNTAWASVGQIKQPSEHERERIGSNLAHALMELQNSGGEILVEAPWGADVDSVVNIMRSMKAKNPDLRCVIVDHFHALTRHKGAPSSEAAMMEERAYKLMTIAKELGIDLIVLAQMNRVGMDPLGSKQAPTLDQIRGTDALAHVSHAVWIARKQAATEEDPNADRRLEFWHAKTRGRQAYWHADHLRTPQNFIEMSVLTMDYPHSCVKTDDTLSNAR